MTIRDMERIKSLMEQVAQHLYSYGTGLHFIERLDNAVDKIECELDLMYAQDAENEEREAA